MTLLEQWKSWDRSRQLGLALGVAALVAIAIVAGYFFLRPAYVPIFANLSPQDSATLVAQLESAKTPYRLDPVSGVVLVPDDQREKIRSTLAGHGFPLKNSVGFELFDNGDFGMTEFTEKINYQRALEGELERTIMALDSVRFARLHLVLPESGLFKRDRDPPKASVLLVTTSDRKLAPEQVSGIQKLVASAVSGLTPDMVSVHDHRGVNLAQADGGNGDVGISAKEAYEVYLSSKVYGMLGHLYPSASFAVSVDATLRSGRMNSTREEVLPAGRAAVSRIRSDLKGNGVDALARAASGETPLPAVTTPGAAPQFDVEYQIGHVTEQSEEAPGQVERVSVGVIVPDPLPEGATIDGLRDLVAAAVGSEFGRGDRVAVYSVAMPGIDSKAIPSAGHAAAAAQAANAPSLLGAKAVDTPVPKQLWILFAAIAAFLLIVVLAGLVRRTKPRALSEAERQALLIRVRQWLREGEASEEFGR
ncbi:MAG: flagellar M-ring protein FliF [Nevskia sp.]|nr:flagellar M-ring protein FliF [Nevskia sp.]